MTLIRTISLAVSFVLGIIIALNINSSVPLFVFPLLAVTGTAWGMWQGVREQAWRETAFHTVIIAAAITGFSLGFWRTAWHTQSGATNTLKSLLESLESDKKIQLQGVIAAEPELRHNRGELSLAVKKIRRSGAEAWQPVDHANVLLRVYPEWGGERDARRNRHLHAVLTPKAYGWNIQVNASPNPPRPVLNFGAFDMEQFLTRQGFAGQLSCSIDDVQILNKSRGNPVTEFALWLKSRFIGTYKKVIRAPASRLVAATTLGTRRAVENVSFKDHDITQTFRHAGVGHVLAVSGLHVSIICILLYSLFRLSGLHPKVFVPVLIGFLIVLAILTGARPSSIRAVIMNSIILIAFAYCSYNLRQATYVGLSLSAIFILSMNPLTLFDPSFLLSFGAVLSLVLIAPPGDRWLRTLHGFSLLLAFIWFVGVIIITCRRLDLLLDPLNLAALAGALWLAILLGNRLNDSRPGAWEIGLDRIPKPLRMFGAAQLAIQIGMMIPLSAWFFGRFPVAGIVVNLLAIPAVAIVVQLGMLTGLAGLLPVLGSYLAMPFGATATVVGYFFFWLAYLGATLFPFPATPKPTPNWMLAYYAGVAAILVLDGFRTRIQGVIYRYWPVQAAPHSTIRRVSLALPLVLIALPALHLLKSAPTCEEIIVMATEKYPVALFVMDDHQAVAVNSGNSFFGGNAMFETLRYNNVLRLHSALITGAHPDIGTTGLAALSPIIPIQTLFLPVQAKSGAEFMHNLGDSYVQEQMRRGQHWAKAYEEGIQALLESVNEKSTRIDSLADGLSMTRGNLTLQSEPLPEAPSTRYVSSAKTAVVRFTAGRLRGVIVTDGLVESLERHIPESENDFDILVISDLSYRASYLELLDRAVELVQPRIVIIAGNEPMDRITPAKWARNHPSVQQVFHTAIHGAMAIDTATGRITLSSSQAMTP